MQAVVFKHTEEIEKIEVQDRFDFEDRCLGHWVHPRPCKGSLEPDPGPRGIRVFLHPVSHDFEAWPYLEFAKFVQNETHFHVMQEGQPTAFTVILGQ